MFSHSPCNTPISIHALRVEGDELAEAVNIELAISIHALRVEGDLILKNVIKFYTFLSTPSGWRATAPFGNI